MPKQLLQITDTHTLALNNALLDCALSLLTRKSQTNPLSSKSSHIQVSGNTFRIFGGSTKAPPPNPPAEPLAGIANGTPGRAAAPANTIFSCPVRRKTGKNAKRGAVFLFETTNKNYLMRFREGFAKRNCIFRNMLNIPKKRKCQLTFLKLRAICFTNPLSKFSSHNQVSGKLFLVVEILNKFLMRSVTADWIFLIRDLALPPTCDR